MNMFFFLASYCYFYFQENVIYYCHQCLWNLKVAKKVWFTEYWIMNGIFCLTYHHDSGWRQSKQNPLSSPPVVTPPLRALPWFFYSSLSFRWSFKQTMAVIIRNEVFSCFVFYGVLLLLKMYIIAIITGQVRLRKKVSDYQRAERNLISALKGFHWCQVFFSFPKKAFANPEDALRHGGLEFYRLDPDVERCRR